MTITASFAVKRSNRFVSRVLKASSPFSPNSLGWPSEKLTTSGSAMVSKRDASPRLKDSRNSLFATLIAYKSSIGFPPFLSPIQASVDLVKKSAQQNSQVHCSFPKIPYSPLRKSYLQKRIEDSTGLRLCLSQMNEIRRCAQPRETVWAQISKTQGDTARTAMGQAGEVSKASPAPLRPRLPENYPGAQVPWGHYSRSIKNSPSAYARSARGGKER